MDLNATDFELFGLPPRHALERELLDARWRGLQEQVHPDRFAAQGAAAQRVAMQWTVRVNEAYWRLKDPLARAAYLCELAGVAVDANRNTAMPAEFLSQQMAWREALDEADGLPAIEALDAEVGAARAAMLAELGRLLDDERDPARAAAQVRALMFVERFAQDVEHRLESLEQD